MTGYGRCPRCGGVSLEHLKTHSHCWECGYAPELEHPKVRISKCLEQEALNGGRFRDNELRYQELFHEETCIKELSSEEIERYYAEREDVL